jgi:hypothetical protein
MGLNRDESDEDAFWREYQGLSILIGPGTHNQQVLWGYETMNKRNGGNVYIWSDLHLGHGNVYQVLRPAL